MPEQLTIELSPAKLLPPLPFTYQRTENPDTAEYQEYRISPIHFHSAPKNEPYTDEQIVDTIRQKKINASWFTSEYWRQKGTPQEQIEITVNNQPITIYNYNSEKPLTDEHLKQAQNVFQEMTSRFPQSVAQLRWILIDNVQEPSTYGDPENYPLHGYALERWKAFKFYPKGMEVSPFRIPATSKFSGVFTHELTHLIQSKFLPEWDNNFQWERSQDHQDQWELRPTPDGTTRKWFNKLTDEMSPQGEYPLQPEQCVTHYSQINSAEDLCESMVAYIFDPEYLKTTSPKKYEILSRHDVKQEKPEVLIRRIHKGEISLPKIEPQTVLYYIQEPRPSTES
ncbi:MAG: hypothetical protein WC596_02705 [Candidatus Shapirobacteria bacterium]